MQGHDGPGGLDAGDARLAVAVDGEMIPSAILGEGAVVVGLACESASADGQAKPVEAGAGVAEENLEQAMAFGGGQLREVLCAPLVDGVAEALLFPVGDKSGKTSCPLLPRWRLFTG